MGKEVDLEDNGTNCFLDANKVGDEEYIDEVELVEYFKDVIISRKPRFELFEDDDKDDKLFWYADDDEPDDVNENDDDERVGNDKGGNVFGGCSKLLSVCLLDLEVVLAIYNVDGNEFIKLSFRFCADSPGISFDKVEIMVSSDITRGVGESVGLKSSSWADFFVEDSNLVWFTQGPIWAINPKQYRLFTAKNINQK